MTDKAYLVAIFNSVGRGQILHVEETLAEAAQTARNISGVVLELPIAVDARRKDA